MSTEAKRTRKGMTLTITNEIHGCLEQGGVSGRVEWYSLQTMIDSGIDSNAPLNPQLDAAINNYGTTLLEWLHTDGRIVGRVLNKGHEIF